MLSFGSMSRQALHSCGNTEQVVPKDNKTSPAAPQATLASADLAGIVTPLWENAITGYMGTGSEWPGTCNNSIAIQATFYMLTACGLNATSPCTRALLQILVYLVQSPTSCEGREGCGGGGRASCVKQTLQVRTRTTAAFNLLQIHLSLDFSASHSKPRTTCLGQWYPRPKSGSGSSSSASLQYKTKHASLTIFHSNLRDSTTEQLLRETFEKHGNITASVRLQTLQATLMTFDQLTRHGTGHHA